MPKYLPWPRNIVLEHTGRRFVPLGCLMKSKEILLSQLLYLSLTCLGRKMLNLGQKGMFSHKVPPYAHSSGLEIPSLTTL